MQELYDEDDGTVSFAVRPLDGSVTSTEKTAATQTLSQARKKVEGWLDSVASAIIEWDQRGEEDVLSKVWEDKNLLMITGDLSLLAEYMKTDNLTKADLDAISENKGDLYISEPVAAANAATISARKGLSRDWKAYVLLCTKAADDNANVEVSDKNKICFTSSLSKLDAAGEYFKKKLSVMLAQNSELMKVPLDYCLLNGVDTELDHVSTACK